MEEKNDTELEQLTKEDAPVDKPDDEFEFAYDTEVGMLEIRIEFSEFSDLIFVDGADVANTGNTHFDITTVDGQKVIQYEVSHNQNINLEVDEEVIETIEERKDNNNNGT